MSGLIYRSFQEACEAQNLVELLTPREFKRFLPYNSQKLAQMLAMVIARNGKIYIDMDCDMDGYCSGLIAQTALDAIGYTNYVMAKHLAKRHVVGSTYAMSLIEQQYDLVLLLDSSTNDMETIKLLSDSGVYVGIIDHHNTNQYYFSSYPDNVAIINPKLEVRQRIIQPYVDASAGALCALFFDYFLKSRYRRNDNPTLYIYGMVSLYADSCNMANPFNRDFVSMYSTFTFWPPLLELFRDKYSGLNWTFINFRLSPRINALVRDEQFELLYKLFYEPTSVSMARESFLAKVEEIYARIRKVPENVIQLLETEKLALPYGLRLTDQFGVVIIPSDWGRYRNFTGLIAGKLAEKHKRPFICLVPVSVSHFDGSCRDHANRNILTAFQNAGFSADGHGPAFGVSVEITQLENRLTILKDIINNVSAEDVKHIVINWDEHGEDFDTYQAYHEALAMARASDLPTHKFYVAVTLPDSGNGVRYYSGPKSSTCNLGDLSITSLGDPLIPRQTVLCSASFNGIEPKLMVKRQLTTYNDI